MQMDGGKINQTMKYDGRGMWFGKEFLEVSPTD